MANEVTAKIKTTYDGKGINQARDELGRFVKQSKTETGGLKDAFSGISDVFGETGQLIGLALGAKEMIDFAVGTFQAAEAARAATSSFESLSGGAEIANLNLQAMRRATRGLISDTEQMQIANQLLGMQIVSTDQELEKVVSVSRQLGKEFRGLGAREAAEEFAIMISNMSVARLDSFGISSGRVRERIEELMRTTEGMTREQAFFQATMLEGEETLSRLGPEITTSADEVSRLSAEWTNLQAAMGGAVEQTGIVQSILGDLSDLLVSLRADFFDDSVEAQIAQLNIELEREELVLEKLSERADTFFGKLGGFANAIPAQEEKLASLRAEMEELVAVQEQSNAVAREQQQAVQDAIRSEEIAIENAAKRAEADKKLADAKEKFSRDVIDLQRQTDDELKDLQDQFADDMQDAEEDHAKRILKLKERSAKDQTKAAQKLQKDLAKVDGDLKKNLAKQQIDENKQITKLQEQSAKEEKQTRRRKQIDAAADERLFQFELRQLAAEGQGNAIKEALERREIEQQIAAEKAEFETQVERDKRDEQIQSVREEGEERRIQLQQQAAERKSDLELRAQEENEARAERLAEELTQEAESYAERQEDLREFLAERQEEIEEGERKRIEELARGLTESEELTHTQLNEMIGLAEEFGSKFGETFADGMTKAFEENLKIDDAIKKSTSIFEDSGGGPLPIAPTETRRSPGGVQIFQQGGIMQGNGLAFLHAGEEIANPNEGQAIVIGGEQFAVREAGRLAGAINAQRARDLQALVDNLSEMLN